MRPETRQTTITLEGEEYAVEMRLLGPEPAGTLVPLDRYRVLIKRGEQLFRRAAPWRVPHGTALEDAAVAAAIQLRTPNNDQEWQRVC